MPAVLDGTYREIEQMRAMTARTPTAVEGSSRQVQTRSDEVLQNRDCGRACRGWDADGLSLDRRYDFAIVADAAAHFMKRVGQIRIDHTIAAGDLHQSPTSARTIVGIWRIA